MIETAQNNYLKSSLWKGQVRLWPGISVAPGLGRL